MSQPNTVFLRLEGPLQSWGDNSKFVIRRCMEAPTKSGVLGLICCAMGLSRQAARNHIPRLNQLAMGARIDRPGMRWWDYHTVGAGVGLLTAEGKLKTGAAGTLITRREYLADAGFLVAVQGDPALIALVAEKIQNPVWPPYLGRKSCPPAVPLFVRPWTGESWTNPMSCDGPTQALRSIPWRPRYEEDKAGHPRIKKDKEIGLDCLVEWGPDDGTDQADAEVWYDAPFSFDPPVHQPRLVRRCTVDVPVAEPSQHHTPRRARPRANYTASEWTSDKLVDVVNEQTGEVTREPRGARPRRLRRDSGLCVFCKQPATTVQHVTYRRAGGGEKQEDLRSLCRLCHDACTMVEYGQGMGLDRIDPCDVRWRQQLIDTRGEILRWRSEEGRRRALRAAPEKVRHELLEEEP